MPTTDKPKRGDTTNTALKYFRNHPGQVLHYTDVALACNIENAQSVATALARAFKVHPEYGLQRVGSGQYQFLQHLQQLNGHKHEPIGKMFEMVGKTQNGTLIVKDEEGVLWKLTEQL